MAKASIKEYIELPLLVLELVVETKSKLWCLLTKNYAVFLGSNLSVAVLVFYLNIAWNLTVSLSLGSLASLPDANLFVIVVNLCWLTYEPSVSLVVLIRVDAYNLLFVMSHGELGIPFKVGLVEDHTIQSYIDTASLSLTYVADNLSKSSVSRNNHWQEQVIGPSLIDIDGCIEAVIEHSVVNTKVQHLCLFPLQVFVSQIIWTVAISGSAVKVVVGSVKSTCCLISAYCTVSRETV